MKRKSIPAKTTVPVNLDTECFEILHTELETEEFTSRSDYVRQAIKYFFDSRQDVQSENE